MMLSQVEHQRTRPSSDIQYFQLYLTVYTLSFRHSRHTSVLWDLYYGGFHSKPIHMMLLFVYHTYSAVLQDYNSGIVICLSTRLFT